VVSETYRFGGEHEKERTRAARGAGWIAHELRRLT
jgi:hypothetical protein